MKGFLIIVTLALALSVAQGLECYNCLYIEDNDDFKDCAEDYDNEAYKVECDSENSTAQEPFYCAKYVGDIDVGGSSKEVIIRNCFNKDGEEATEDELNEDCNVGRDYEFSDDGEVHRFYGGKLCICEDEFCNSGTVLGIPITLGILCFILQAVIIASE